MARPRAITSDHKRLAMELAALGNSRREIADTLGVAPVTLRREVARDPQFAQQLRTVEHACSGERRLGSTGRMLMRMFVVELRAAFARHDAS